MSFLRDPMLTQCQYAVEHTRLKRRLAIRTRRKADTRRAQRCASCRTLKSAPLARDMTTIGEKLRTTTTLSSGAAKKRLFRWLCISPASAGRNPRYGRYPEHTRAARSHGRPARAGKEKCPVLRRRALKRACRLVCRIPAAAVCRRRRSPLSLAHGCCSRGRAESGKCAPREVRPGAEVSASTPRIDSMSFDGSFIG